MPGAEERRDESAGSDGEDARPPNVIETFDRLLNTAAHAIEQARRGGACADEVREAAGLTALDVIDLGELLGLLHDVEAERRREEIRAAIDDLQQR